MSENKKFWMNDPKTLFSSCQIIPTSDMTNAERLNALTRLLIIITVGMYFMGYDHYFTVLALGILLIVVLRANQKREGFRPHRGRPDPCGTCGFNAAQSYINSKYEVTPELQFNHDNASKRSYANAKYELNPLDVPQPFREIWRKEPEFCGEYSMIPDPYTVSPINDFHQPRGQCNYITRSFIDHLPISQAQTGLVSARPAVESAFMRDTLEFRNSIMGEHVDRFMRERQHNCSDIKVGRKTF